MLARAKYLHLDDDDQFMPINWAKKSSSTKGKSVAKP
jgi:hypothetical protein